MSEFKTRYGLDWPASLHDIFIDLLVAKKWREYGLRDIHPGAILLRAARALFTPAEFTISPWTEQHAHDWTTSDFCVTWGGASCSKALPLDAEVLTPRGYRRNGDLDEGDVVIAQDGKPSVVLTVHERSVLDEYRVMFRDGTSTRCSGDHLWEVEYRGGSYRRARLMTTERMRDFAPGKLSIPFCEPVYQEKKPLPIDPYVLGCLLGDGGITQSVVLTSTDEDIVAAFSSRLRPGYALVRNPGDKAGYRVVKASRGKGANWYIRQLKALGLWGRRAHDKFIPCDYLHNEERHRRELLAGLLDTDGSVSKCGSISFTSVSRPLADGVASLVRSLGGMAVVSGPYPAHYLRAGVRVPCRESHRVNISVRDARSLFKCGRKLSRVRLDRAIAGRRYIDRVEKTGRSVPMRCITIDHPRGLYMTNDYIVTHNSNDYGCFALLDWVTDPTETYTVMASTTKEMLKVRSYEAVLRYFRILKGNPYFSVPGKESNVTTALLNDSDADDDSARATVKASLRGVAVKEGSKEKSRANLQGAHLPYVRMVLDEMAQLPEAAVDARVNLSIGCRDFRFFGLANPDSFHDLSARYSEPLEGWGSVDENTEEWETRWGKVRHHNGYFSPSVTEPDGAVKYPYLISPDRIAKIEKEHRGNSDHPDIWTMIKGFPPPQGSVAAVLSHQDLSSFGALGDVSWEDVRACVPVAGLDPAFTSGGDDCKFQPGLAGIDSRGRLCIAPGPAHNLVIEASSPRPVAYQIADQVRALCKQLGISAPCLACDDSGTQSVADVLQVVLGAPVIRVNFCSRPSDDPRFPGSEETMRDHVADAVTEIWVRVADFVRAGQVRCFPAAAAGQFTTRALIGRKGVKRLESKEEYGKRTGEGSPDDGDALALMVWAAVRALGCRPRSDSFSRPHAAPPGVTRADLESRDGCPPDYSGDWGLTEGYAAASVQGHDGFAFGFGAGLF